MAVTFVQDIYNHMDNAVTTVISGKMADVISLVSPLFFSAFSLYVLFLVFSYWKTGGDGDTTFFDMIQRIAAWAIILSFSLNLSGYTSTIVPIITGIPEELSGVFTGTGSVAGSLDGVITSIIQLITNTQSSTGGLDIAGSIRNAFLIFASILGFAPFIIISTAYILLAKLFMSLLVVFGPIFIALALFPSTRQYFSSWVNQIVNYTLLLVFVTALASIQVAYFQSILDSKVDPILTFYTVIIILINSAVFYVIILKMPEIASALSGGMQIEGFGSAARSAKAAAGGVAGAMKYAGSFGGKGGGGSGGSLGKGGAAKKESDGI